MSRLYDRLRKSGPHHPLSHARMDFGGFQDLAYAKGGLPECVVIDATNVSDYWAEHYAAELVGMNAFPNIAPPFEHFFVEYAFDVSSMSETVLGGWLGKGTSRPGALLPERVGVLGLAYDLMEDPDDPMPWRILGEGWEDKREEIRFVMMLVCFWEYGKGRIRGPMYTFTFPLYSDGSIVPHTSGEKASITHLGMYKDGDTDSEREMMALLGQWSLNPTLLALSFFHCRNVARVPHDAPEKVQAKHLKRHGVPLTRYYTLEIQPMKDVIARADGKSTGELKRALHITRGHFATYSPEKPMFGRFVGTVFRPQHVRGSKSRGEVVKDYRVARPDGGG